MNSKQSLINDESKVDQILFSVLDVFYYLGPFPDNGALGVSFAANRRFLLC